jgi:hypothetical protein
LRDYSSEGLSREELKKITGLRLPDHPTSAVGLFLMDCLRLSEFRLFVTATSLFTLKHLELARKEYVAEGGHGTVHNYFAQTYGERGFEVQYRPDHHREFLAEILLTKTAEFFLKYLADLLSLVFRTKPQTLKSGEHETLEFILGFTDMRELVDAIAEKRVERLSFLGTRELSDFFEDRLGFSLTKDDEEMLRLVGIIETRNIIVHNRRIVSKLFKQRLPHHPGPLGSRVKVDYETVLADCTFIENLASDIDTRAVLKWGLPAAGTRE